MLHPSQTLKGFKIDSADGAVGSVREFLIDDETWAIRYLVINAGGWPAKSFLVSPRWISSVSWAESQAFMTVKRDAVHRSPEFTEQALQNWEYEHGLHSHYKKLGHWVDERPSRACEVASARGGAW